MKNLPDDYFLDADDDLVDFLEKQGEDCIREIYQSNSVNRENGYKLLSILIVGIGSSFLFLTQRQHPDFLSFGIIVFTLYWSICAMCLVLGVLSVRVRGLISATPDCLYTESYKNINDDNFKYFTDKGYSGKKEILPIMRRYRLRDLCITAEELVTANVRIRTNLRRVRIATILTPVCAIFISAITYFFS
ncbi:hypothetical protein JC794_14045 [Morganella morganii]|uniref:hypothetical protein n=1 Tax=Morganella morganii TaxID=582 RepID=UPI001C464766|nr:hypothetical protein [Morganella morganii]QXO59753.1 hypothetical protein JC827_14040 [Morganella morganii]QXO78718.1 hypothetical protein JC794_14045 [Morganella morganii]